DELQNFLWGAGVLDRVSSVLHVYSTFMQVQGRWSRPPRAPRPVRLRPARGAAPSGITVALLLDLIQRVGTALHRRVDVRPLTEAEQPNAEGGQALWPVDQQGHATRDLQAGLLEGRDVVLLRVLGVDHHDGRRLAARRGDRGVAA